MFSLLKSLRKRKPYIQELAERIDPLSRLLNQYYSPNAGPKHIIASSKSEVDLMIDMSRSGRTSSNGRYMYQLYDELSTDQNPEVVFMWPDYDGLPEALNSKDADSIALHHNNYTKTFRINDLPDTALFQARHGLNTLYNHAQTIDMNGKYVYTDEFDYISLDQDVVDYIIKLESIGSDKELFQTLFAKDNTWHGTFFEPLHAINQRLQFDTHTAPSRHQELDYLLKWSSSKIT